MSRFVWMLMLVSANCFADISGTKYIYLYDKHQQSHQIGKIDFTHQAGKINYQLDIDTHSFKDYFLSMKEMKCLEGPELWCYIPYPYHNPHFITETDLAWLEHDLLFMYKPKGSFGANLWNGIYYKLTINSQQQIEGQAHSVDLNIIAAPSKQVQAPIKLVDLDESEPELRWLPTIVIK